MISIVTITLNNFKELKRTLESLPKENFIESVIINGGSCKETRDYLQSYKGKVINEKDSGIAEAFNKGVINSTGDAVMFLNSGDVLLEPSYLREAEDILQKNKEINFIHSNLLFKDLTGADLFMKPTFSNPGRGIPYLHPTMVVRKKVFNEAGLFNTNYKIAMDFDFIIRMEKKGFKGFYVDKSPVVLMEGFGKSSVKEWDAIKECYRSLKENNFLNLKNITFFFIRTTLFIFRKILISTGGVKLLKKLKEKKYSSG